MTIHEKITALLESISFHNVAGPIAKAELMTHEARLNAVAKWALSAAEKQQIRGCCELGLLAFLDALAKMFKVQRSLLSFPARDQEQPRDDQAEEQPAGMMCIERFNELLAGPLHHDLFPFQVSRLTNALLAVVWACGKAGADALEAHALTRQQQDERAGE